MESKIEELNDKILKPIWVEVKIELQNNTKEEINS
jgi:hypothetical protein